MCIHLLHHQPTPAADAQPIQDPSTSTNIHKPTPSLVSSRVVDFFGTPHLVGPARLYGLQCVKNVLRINSELQKKRVECGNFWGVWSPAPPPTVRRTLGSATNGLMGLALLTHLDSTDLCGSVTSTKGTSLNSISF